MIKKLTNTYLFHPIAIGLFLLLPLLPFAYFVSSFYSDIEHLNYLEERLESLYIRSKAYNLEKEQQCAMVKQIEQADHFYIDKNLENLTFLRSEVKRLQSLAQSTDEKDPIRKRLRYLLENNRLRFLEEKISREGKLQEVEENQQAAIELDTEDLKKLLVTIEGSSIAPFEQKEDRPHLIIKQLQLAKKTLSPQEEVFTLTMQLIKKESIQKE